jgi:hypothetical protein
MNEYRTVTDCRTNTYIWKCVKRPKYLGKHTKFLKNYDGMTVAKSIGKIKVGAKKR